LSQRSKNLLEAFNQSKAPEKSTQPPPQARGSAPRVGGPFADAAPPPLPKAQPKVQEGRQVREETSRVPGSRLRVALLCTLIAVTFFYVGRVSAPSVEAAGGASPAPGNVPEVASPQNAAPSRTPTIREALVDPKNRYAILASTYKKNAESEAIARAARDRMAGLGFPCELGTKDAKKEIYLLIGAAPSVAALDSLLAQIKSTKSDKGKLEFVDAHAVPIDSYLTR